MIPPTAEIYTLADILAACVNSTGVSSTAATLCGQLFALTTPQGGTAPIDTVTALLDIEKNPTLNTAGLFNLVQPNPPFQTALSMGPSSFAVSLMPMAGSAGLTLTPSSLSFATTATGFTAPSQSVVVSNTGTGAVAINSISIAGANAADFTQKNGCVGSVAMGATCTIQVSFKPGATGPRSASLAISSSIPGSPQTAALSGAGGAPSAGPVTLSAASLSYVVANTIQDLTVSNFGNTPLTIRGISSSDPSFFVETNGCGTYLLAQSVCTISVESTGFQFNGSTSQYMSYSGTLKVDDDAAAGAQTVALSSTNSVTLSATFGAGPLGLPLNFGAWPVSVAVAGGTVTSSPGSYYTYEAFAPSVGGPNASDFVNTGSNYCTMTSTRMQLSD